MLNYQSLIEQLVPICQTAMKEIMHVYATFETGDEVVKSDDSPLTVADMRSHQCIIHGLSQVTPVIPIISEEHKNMDYQERKDLPYVWVIDPLDGTKEFVKKNGEFCVNIALVQGNKAVLGMVGIPARMEIAYAYEGGGAHLIFEEGEIDLHCKPFNPKAKGLRIVASRSHMNEDTKKFVGQFDEVEMVPKGSALKFLSIAQGMADLYPRLAPTMEWDTAAPQVILKEAGGKVLRADDGCSLRYNKESLLNPFFIAMGNGDLA